ncbi:MULTISPECIES: DUF1822 family protein [Calothrix]|uniref:DUF1822 family protein n=2 Tax=Calothrix TaxID=1186 RepID=A0ABR8AJ16_9CYAN|nr:MULTISPECIES: DUF1822 family protein [Calothrix]MBD2199966.1 DUF1822 family protein [Calothrix parietina FACHB-288]MBD2228867.1 DUF1822 family protein [Calothrix anomala FACHB-343]
MSFKFAQPQEWWLDVPPLTRTESWEQSQQHATPNSRWNAYINQICLKAVLARIQANNTPEASIWLNDAQMPALWEVVNGSAITIGATRLVLIPTEAIDDGELEVPQEWVDIPNWVGDYYIAVQIRPESEWLRVWGYTTHHQLKTTGTYDASDRTYCIDAEDLTDDMDSLWVRCQFYPDLQTRVDISPLTELSTIQTENLIQRLGNPEMIFPRLQVPFSTWGALLSNNNSRQKLYAMRLGITNKVTELTRLSEWLRGNFAPVWQTIQDTLTDQQIATAWRGSNTRSLTNQNSVFDVNRVKVLDFGSPVNQEQVALLIGVSATNDTEVTIGVNICPTDNADLPHEVQVRLLDEDGNEIAQASANVTQTIQLQFAGQQGEKFSIEITCGDKSMTEYFVI